MNVHETLRVGIVGSSASKWNIISENEARRLIYDILTLFRSSPKSLVLVSGRCPRSICENCGKRSFSKITDPLEGYVRCGFCGRTKKRRAGGVDIWAEDTAKGMKVRTRIFNPKGMEWKFYKERNIQIAEYCDIVIDIEPKGKRSGGTWTMEYAAKLGKIVLKYEIAPIECSHHTLPDTPDCIPLPDVWSGGSKSKYTRSDKHEVV